MESPDSGTRRVAVSDTASTTNSLRVHKLRAADSFLEKATKNPTATCVDEMLSRYATKFYVGYDEIFAIKWLLYFELSFNVKCAAAKLIAGLSNKVKDKN